MISRRDFSSMCDMGGGFANDCALLLLEEEELEELEVSGNVPPAHGYHAYSNSHGDIVAEEG